MHKAVLILAFAHQQIEVHLGAAKTDVQAFEAVDPAFQRTREREVRIQLAGDVAGAGEAHVPRLQRLAALVGRQLLQAARVGLAGFPLETIQNGEQLLRRHALGFVHLVVEIVAIAHLARKAVA